MPNNQWSDPLPSAPTYTGPTQPVDPPPPPSDPLRAAVRDALAEHTPAVKICACGVQTVGQDSRTGHLEDVIVAALASNR